MLSGTPEQVEHAAEIGMEDHLRPICDPDGDPLPIRCIEHSAIASVNAINAARMALRDASADKMTSSMETTRGGLAVNIVECRAAAASFNFIR